VEGNNTYWSQAMEGLTSVANCEQFITHTVPSSCYKYLKTKDKLVKSYYLVIA